MGTKLETAIGILNGTLGDYLARTGNGLATEMQCVRGGEVVELSCEGLARAYPRASGKLAVFVHGVTNTESIWTMADGQDFGALLERDLGYTPVYLRYNSGLAIPRNGELLSELLGQLVAAYPVELEELIPFGYSMGGLLFRSACHFAKRDGQSWLKLVRRAFYIGTPHRGALLERAGRILARALRAIPEPVTRLVGEIGDLRSEGIKDLGDADLRPEDRGRRLLSLSLSSVDHPVPLLPEIRHYLVAGSVSSDPRATLLFGDGIVPLNSATNGTSAGAESLRALPPGRIRVMPGLSHLRLASHPDVYRQLRQWCEEDSP